MRLRIVVAHAPAVAARAVTATATRWSTPCAVSAPIDGGYSLQHAFDLLVDRSPQKVPDILELLVRGLFQRVRDPWI